MGKEGKVSTVSSEIKTSNGEAESRRRSAKDILKNVRKIEVSVNHLVDSLVFGSYRSRFKGQGLEFSEVREYRVGDDIRAIDWNVTARMGSPHVKEFIEERDLSVYIVFDVSGSLDFGTQTDFKKNVGVEIVASIAFACAKNNDRVGLILSTDVVEKYFPARKGKRHILSMISGIANFEAKSRATDLHAPITYLSKMLKRKSIIFVISDFMDDVSRFEKQLRMLSKRHDVIAVRVEDEREAVMPDVGLIAFEDEETGEQIAVDTTDAEFMREYMLLVDRQRALVSGMLRRNKIDVIEVNTSASFVKPVVDYFNKKKRAFRVR